MPVSFTSNSFQAVDSDTWSYTVQKGNTLYEIAKEISKKTGKAYSECYSDLIRENDFKDAKLNPNGTRDPNLIYAQSSKHDADVLKFTVDATAKEKLSSFCSSNAPTADTVVTERGHEAGTATFNRSTSFADHPPVWASNVPVLEEDPYGYDSDGDGTPDSSRADEEYAERFYAEGEFGVQEFGSADEAYDSLIFEDSTEEPVESGPLPEDGVIGLNGDESLDADYEAVDTGVSSNTVNDLHAAHTAWMGAIYGTIPEE